MACSSSRSFPCNFCDRKFRSAQALGGHMNLHRRERVRPQNPIATLFSGGEVGFRYLFPANRDADALENWFLQFGRSGAVLKNQPCSDTSIKANDVYNFDVKEERAKFHSYLPEFNSGLKSETGQKLETGQFYGDAAVGELDLELRL